MTELRRLLESSDDELERALLRSVRGDLPAPVGLRETALVLGLAMPTANALAATLPAAGSLVTSSASSLATSSGVVVSGGVAGSAATGGVSGAVATVGVVSLGALGKSLVGGALVSFLALTAYDQTLGLPGQGEQSPPAVARSVEVTPPPAQAALEPPSLPVVAEPQLDELMPATPAAASGSRRAAALVEERAPAKEAPSAQPPAVAAFAPEPRPEPAPAAANASLAAEIRVLDQARAALVAGDSDRASQLLDSYATSRPSVTLAQEAALLRVRLLLTRGQRPAAADLARRIIAEHPESAHVESLRKLAAEP